MVNALTTGAAQHLLPACRQTQTPLIMTVLTRTSLDTCRAATDYAHAIVALNENTISFIAENHPHLAAKLHLSSKPLLLPTSKPRPSKDTDTMTVTYMVRLSRTKGQYAAILLEACQQLGPMIPHLRLIIVGSGRRLRNVRKQAAKLNRQLQSPVVEVYGTTLDPEPFFTRTDILLGAGYTALQGLAWGCKVIGIGFAGLFGRLTPENISEAITANFGDTGTQ